MSEHDQDQDLDVERPDQQRLDKGSEPQAGEGPRSLQNWQNLAKVRQSLSANDKNREQYDLDPIGYMNRFGVDVGTMTGPGQSAEAVAHLQMAPSTSEGPDVQLAFCKVWGIVVVVAGVVANAGANANAVANANAGVNINAGANLNVNVNGVGPAYEE